MLTITQTAAQAIDSPNSSVFLERETAAELDDTVGFVLSERGQDLVSKRVEAGSSGSGEPDAGGGRMNQREREAEKRRGKLLDIEAQVADGSLTIRPMTKAERDRFGIGDDDRPFRRFFFPGARPGTRRGEQEYRDAARALRAETGSRPTARRVFRVDCVLDGRRCRFEVGEEAAVAGGVVTAIFELAGADELVVSTADTAVAVRVPASDADVVEFT